MSIDKLNLLFMKSFSKPIFFLLAIVACSILFGLSYNTHSVSDFQITIERSESEVALKCETGCSWNTLSWTCPPSGECKWGVDPMGMFRPASPPAPTGEGFQIIVQDSTDQTMMLTCKRGCAWKELTWTCERQSGSCKAEVDFNGLSSR